MDSMTTFNMVNLAHARLNAQTNSENYQNQNQDPNLFSSLPSEVAPFFQQPSAPSSMSNPRPLSSKMETLYGLDYNPKDKVEQALFRAESCTIPKRHAFYRRAVKTIEDAAKISESPTLAITYQFTHGWANVYRVTNVFELSRGEDEAILVTLTSEGQPQPRY